MSTSTFNRRQKRKISLEEVVPAQRIKAHGPADTDAGAEAHLKQKKQLEGNLEHAE